MVVNVGVRSLRQRTRYEGFPSCPIKLHILQISPNEQLAGDDFPDETNSTNNVIPTLCNKW